MRKCIFLCVLFCLSFITLQAQILPEVEELGLWCVYIETENGEEPTCEVISAPAGCLGEGITNANKVPCRVFISSGGGTLFDSGYYIDGESGAIIKVRGNTSASQFEKKPYKIKLQKKADMLCRANKKYDDKDWLLIKDWGVHGLMGFTLNRLLGLPYSPEFKYVNVVLNGIYKGTYLLCESVKRNVDSRINVSKTGCIFEYDAYWWNEEVYVESSYDYPMHYTFKYPDSEKIDSDFIESFTNYINMVEQSLKTGNYEQYLEIETFVLWVLGQDVLGNFDAAGSNISLSKYDDTEESKIQMPCLWDFDGIMGTRDRLPDTFSNVHRLFYFKDLFSDSGFASNYISAYEQFSPSLFDSLISTIQEFVKSDYGQAYKKSYEKDHTIWNFYSEMNIDMPFDDRIENTLDWLTSRHNELDAAVAQMKMTTDMQMYVHHKSNCTPHIYNLSGIKASSYKGIKIANGKKMVVGNECVKE